MFVIEPGAYPSGRLSMKPSMVRPKYSARMKRSSLSVTNILQDDPSEDFLGKSLIVSGWGTTSSGVNIIKLLKSVIYGFS
jgi:hypothetical protein